MPISELGMAGAQAGMDVVGSAIGGWINKGNSKSLMRYQNQLAVENWRMQNEYNHPAAQMARLREAGLNPSLFYSSGQGVNSNSTNPGAPTPSSAANVDLSGLGTGAAQTYLSSKMQKQQLQNMKSQNDQTQAEINLKKLEYAMELAKKPYFEKAAKQWIDSLMLDNQVKDSTVKKFESETSNTMAATQNLYATFDQIKAQVKNIDQDTVAKKIHSSVEKALSESQIKVNEQTKQNLEREFQGMFWSNGIQEFNYNILKNTTMDPGEEASLLRRFTAALYNQFINGHFSGSFNYNSSNRTSTFQMK